MGVDVADYDRSGRHAPGGRQLRQPDDRPLPQRRQRPFRRRSAAFPHRPRQPAEPDLRPLLLRLRPGRLPRHLRRQRPHRRTNRPRSAENSVRRNASALSQRRQRQISTGTSVFKAFGGPRSRLRRLRSRWRSGHLSRDTTTALRICTATTAATRITGCKFA